MKKQDLIIQTGECMFKIPLEEKLAKGLFTSLVTETSAYLEALSSQCTCGETHTKNDERVEAHSYPTKEIRQTNNTNNDFDLNKRKIRLAIIKCPKCGTQAVCLVDDYNKPFVCKFCGEEISYANTRKGHYECECGANATFYMNHSVSEVKCNKCGKTHYMVQDTENKEYSYIGI